MYTILVKIFDVLISGHKPSTKRNPVHHMCLNHYKIKNLIKSSTKRQHIYRERKYIYLHIVTYIYINLYTHDGSFIFGFFNHD